MTCGRNGSYLLTEKNFRSAIPHGNDFVSVDANWDGNCSSESEISQLDISGFVD